MGLMRRRNTPQPLVHNTYHFHEIGYDNTMSYTTAEADEDEEVEYEDYYDGYFRDA